MGTHAYGISDNLRNNANELMLTLLRISSFHHVVSCLTPHLPFISLCAVVDVYIYEVLFEGMKLAGILLILIGFMLVLLPEDWPDYLTMILRYRRSSRRRRTVAKKPTPQDTATGHRSRLRTPSGRIK